MCAYIYESIRHSNENRIKLFTASMDYSGFHWHHDYEIVLVLKGQIEIVENASELCLDEGNFLLLNSRAVHAIRRKTRDNLCLFLQISPELLGNTGSNFYYFYLNSRDASKEPGNGYAHYRRLLAKAGYENSLISPNKYRINAYIYTLLADLFDFAIYDIYQKGGLDSLDLDDVELFMQIVDYIQENCCSQDVLSEARKQLGLGEKTLYRFMKKYTGRSPKQFVLEHRINIAMNMLRNTKYSIPYIASYCGFNAENTFYRAFKQEAGITPGEYQKQNTDVKIDMEIKGYLPFHQEEARYLLKKYASEV